MQQLAVSLSSARSFQIDANRDFQDIYEGRKHRAISAAIHHRGPAEKVRGISRHASLDTLMIYYHEADRIDDPAEQYINYD